jgi:hypothetical protein
MTGTCSQCGHKFPAPDNRMPPWCAKCGADLKTTGSAVPASPQEQEMALVAAGGLGLKRLFWREPPGFRAALNGRNTENFLEPKHFAYMVGAAVLIWMALTATAAAGFGPAWLVLFVSTPTKNILTAAVLGVILVIMSRFAASHERYDIDMSENNIGLIEGEATRVIFSHSVSKLVYQRTMKFGTESFGALTIHLNDGQTIVVGVPDTVGGNELQQASEANGFAFERAG